MVHLVSLAVFVGLLGTWLISVIPADIVTVTRSYILPSVLGGGPHAGDRVDEAAPGHRGRAAAAATTRTSPPCSPSPNCEAAASGAPKPLIEELYTFPRNYNDPDATAELVAGLQKVLGENNVEPSSPMMGSEDFGLLAEVIGVPSVFWMFGGHTAETLESGKPVPVNHSPSSRPSRSPPCPPASRRR
ncbi:hypothetical protein [Rhodococcus opacus]|uniref:hypothetical protein n=1 Tax=Rhodococcus opacus TaxID=37919 RepID=UPI00211E6C92|nr:hypothetical protein [Rhodococcus opacus]